MIECSVISTSVFLVWVAVGIAFLWFLFKGDDF